MRIWVESRVLRFKFLAFLNDTYNGCSDYDKYIKWKLIFYFYE